MLDHRFIGDCSLWLADQVAGMTETIRKITPSDFNEQNRYIPASVSPLPGYMDFSVNPFMREIVDCFDIDSPVREVNLRKGVQITYTTALESVLLYAMAQVKTAPVMFVTADRDLAAARVENNIIPMIQQSGLSDIIRSSDEGNSRKSGKTANHIQWIGGGYLVPYGANNANKMRMFSIQFMLKDEIDAWPDVVGKDGDPDRLTDDRCAAYWERRKIFRGSTPLIKGTSKIQKAYERGDQRKYHVHCLKCGFPQEIIWRGTDKESGRQYGLLWETDNGVLVPESVRWACANCGHGHHEHDKIRLLDDRNNGAHWVPTARPVESGIRSYHLPALYSPNGMQPWYKSVATWLDAWDEENNRARDVGKLQVFYNNVLALPFEVRGDKVQFVNVSGHRRAEYGLGSVPNRFCVENCTSRVQILVCTVDVQDAFLSVAVHGWTRGQRAVLIDYWRFDGDSKRLDDPGTWGRLRDLIETKVYTADDGVRYNISITLVDSSYSNDLVTRFCGEYAAGVYPILGRDTATKNQKINEFAPFVTQHGTTGYRVTVDLYKDRWQPRLNRPWSGESEQPEGCYNAPVDLPDKALKELTVETKREKIDRQTGKRMGFVWHRPSGARNELWDLLVYANAALDLVAWDVCINQLGLDFVNWQSFWDVVESREMFYSTEAS